MAGSSFGKLFKITTWGESHGKALGVVVDGCPSGLALTEKDIMKYLSRRKPGQSRYTTKRKEDDQVEILSGVFEGKTTGTPISLIVYNQDQHSRDYGNIADTYRPGHADFGFDAKFGFRDYRGGGRSSGRETIGRVAAGAIAAKLLASLGIEVQAFATGIGPVTVSPEEYHLEDCSSNALYMPNMEKATEAQAFLETCMETKDSSGGTIVCQAKGVPAGLGDPVFDKLDATLAQALMSIGAVKSVAIGDGAKVACAKGSDNNDSFLGRDENGTVQKGTNHAGGILGGISDGTTISLEVSVKPTPSIAQEQHSMHTDGTPCTLTINGRHDPVIVPRAVVVVESMVSITLVDALLGNMASRLDLIQKFYQ